MATLEIKDLFVEVEGKLILKGLNFTMSNNEVVALLGKNGHGKSTLLNVIMGHPRYHVISGSMTIDGKDLLCMTPDERAKAGLFFGMQYPSEVPGVNNDVFLRAALNSRLEKPISTYQFYKKLDAATKELDMPFDLATRNLNEGFSGGEKKRNEILQLILLEPQIAMLDEIDSGLDVDAMNVVSNVINKEINKGRGFLIVSHYARLFELIPATRAVVMVDGRVALEGDASLIKKIDTEGYEFLKTDYGIDIEKEEKDLSSVSLGNCAVKEVIK